MTTGESALAAMIAALLNDEEDLREDVIADLKGFGVNVRDERAAFRALLDGLRQEGTRAILDDASRRRERRAKKREGKRRKIQDMRLPMAELRRMASASPAARAHRSFERDTREDLESFLADQLSDDEGEEE